MLTNDEIITQLQLVPGVESIHLMFMFGGWNCSCEYRKNDSEGHAVFKGEFKGRDKDFRTALLQMYDGLMQIAEYGIPDFGVPRLELQANEHEAAKRLDSDIPF